MSHAIAYKMNTSEGITKIQDGGRFVDWNPVNGPNSFLMVDNNVNTVESSRVDLTVTSISLPNTITTFKSEVYQIFTIDDENEYLREDTLKTYTNSYGFGDSAVTVFVGGTLDSICKLKPGDTTYIKLAFYNNCGFDWKLIMTKTKKLNLKIVLHWQLMQMIY